MKINGTTGTPRERLQTMLKARDAAERVGAERIELCKRLMNGTATQEEREAFEARTRARALPPGTLTENLTYSAPIGSTE